MLKQTRTLQKSFSVLEKAMKYINNDTFEHLNLANFDAKKPTQPFSMNIVRPADRAIKITTLPNGVRILSETPSLPGAVTMGVLLEVGSANETKDTSGALFSIKSTYYKSSLNTNETINYGMVQMSGGKYDMNFDRERTVFKASCLSHDVSDIFAMMSDCVLEPRSSVAANAAISKLKHLHKVNQVKCPGKEDTDNILAEIFGHQGIGMPLCGHEKNIENLNAFNLQKFQIENFSPERIIIAGLGVENHGEFVNLVEEYYGNIRYAKNLHKNEKPVFREIEIKSIDQTAHKNTVYMIFESIPVSHADFVIANLAREFLGSADIGNPSNQENNFGLFVDQIYSKETSVYSIESFNLNFNETGVFGIKLVTGSDSSNKGIDSVVKTLRGTLEKLTDAQILGAKKRLARKVGEAICSDYTRVDEILKHQSAFGEIRLEKFLKDLESISAKDLVNFFKSTLRGKTGLYVKGSHPSNVYGLAKVKELMK